MKYEKIVVLKHHLAALTLTVDGQFVYIDGLITTAQDPGYIRGLLDGVKETITVYYEG
jgi:hypothetical protein